MFVKYVTNNFNNDTNIMLHTLYTIKICRIHNFLNWAFDKTYYRKALAYPMIALSLQFSSEHTKVKFS